MKTVSSRFYRAPLWRIAAWLATGLMLATKPGVAQQNLLKNPGFEENAVEVPVNWRVSTDAGGAVKITSEAHSGTHGLAIAANTAVEQRVDALPTGAYVARCWVKSQTEQPVTLLLQDPDSPWAAYTCAEKKAPAGQWVQLEAFCALDRAGALKFTVGGMSKEFRLYHGTSGEMNAPIIADDFELLRNEPKPPAELAPMAIWDTKKQLAGTPNWPEKNDWTKVENSGQTFAGTPVVQSGHLAGVVRKSGGALQLYALEHGAIKPRALIIPSPGFSADQCAVVQSSGRSGIRVASKAGDRGYTAWFTSNGVVSIQADQVSSFKIQDCHLRYGLLPSFVGTDICYAPANIQADKFNIPSTQWLVGLVDGNDSVLVAVWESPEQAVSLGLAGKGPQRSIDSLSIDTTKTGFSLSFLEHAGIWHQEALSEDWLSEYVPIQWKPPFPARWMEQFFVTPGGKPSFRQPNMDYSFPVAWTKTRMWGVWFEDWNHYPFYFDGPRTILHFEKTFVPNREALFYFLEPAAADLLSPVEIVEQVLGPKRAAEMLDLDGNQLRKLNYSTPSEFMYDRPVCATTTRLSKIKKDEKATVGVNLATHLYEFIREIRGRVDQYEAFFDGLGGYLAKEQTAHPELRDYVAGLSAMIDEARTKSKEIYATPLSVVQRKTDGIKKRLQESGGNDGFDCAELDVRSAAGAQDDLCRRYNRMVMRLMQTAALQCADSPEKASVARYLWGQARTVLRRPTRWEPRRTLYFFEP